MHYSTAVSFVLFWLFSSWLLAHVFNYLCAFFFYLYFASMLCESVYTLAYVQKRQSMHYKVCLNV